MVTRQGRGGPRQPANPAPVSNPQSGRRTDGGAGSKSQPLRVASGGAYGQRQAATNQQQAAPLANEEGITPTPDANMISGANQPQGGGMFGPTQRPAEMNSANVGQPQDPMQDSDKVLRIMYSIFPHPNIQRMLNRKRDYR